MEKISKPCGRPCGRQKTAKIEVMIEKEVKEEFMKILRSEGKMASVEIGAWIRDYINKTKKEREQ